MNIQTQLTSDVIGLTKVAPFSRRGFMTASAAVAAGYTLAAGPVRADVITTSIDGLDAGEAKIKVADGEMPGYFARPKGVANPARRQHRSARHYRLLPRRAHGVGICRP
jgi:carboxymethylenebutenolidase